MLPNKLLRLFRGSHRIETNHLCYFITRPVLYERLSQPSLQEAIDDLQTQLVERGLLTDKSGVFDTNTKMAVEKFQQHNHLRVDGIVGGLTWAALMYPKLVRTKAVCPETDEAVRKLQQLLRHEKINVKIDGFFGRKTERAVKQFQQRYGLLPDGVCGAMTWSVLVGQRPAWNPDPPWQKFWLRAPRILEQLLTIAAIHIGIHFSPWAIPNDLSFLNTFVTAYGLTCVALPFLETFCTDYLEITKFPLLRFSPYVLVGFLFRRVLAWVLTMLPS